MHQALKHHVTPEIRTRTENAAVSGITRTTGERTPDKPNQRGEGRQTKRKHDTSSRCAKGDSLHLIGSLQRADGTELNRFYCREANLTYLLRKKFVLIWYNNYTAKGFLRGCNHKLLSHSRQDAHTCFKSKRNAEKRNAALQQSVLFLAKICRGKYSK